MPHPRAASVSKTLTLYACPKHLNGGLLAQAFGEDVGVELLLREGLSLSEELGVLSFPMEEILELLEDQRRVLAESRARCYRMLASSVFRSADDCRVLCAVL